MRRRGVLNNRNNRDINNRYHNSNYKLTITTNKLNIYITTTITNVSKYTLYIRISNPCN